MPQPYDDDPDLRSPRNPENSVLHPEVRSKAVRTYLLPLVGFFVVVGLALAYWATRPVVSDYEDEEDQTRVAGTTGERSPGHDQPGGHNPDLKPTDTEDEIVDRVGRPITSVSDIFKEEGRTSTGRRVELNDVEVERVDSPTSLWVKDGDTRVEVVAPAGTRPLKPGQRVRIAGVVQRTGDTLWIRGSRVAASD